MATFQDRMIRAAKLDPDIYEEVEADQNSTGQAVGVVVLASVAAGIGGGLHAGFGGLIVGTLGALISWYIWALLTYLIGTKLLPEEQTHSDVGELLRTTGFSASPGILRVLGIIPGLREIVFLAAGVWMLVAMVIAVRQALDYQSTGRAVGVCVIGWVIQIAALALFLALAGGGST